MERKPFQARFNALKDEANNWSPAWKDLQRFIRPTRGFFNDLPNRGTTIDHKTVLDSSPGRAARILAAGMTSGLTSPSRPWFKLGFTDQNLMQIASAKEWLDDVENRMMAAFSKSNIYGILHSSYEEIGVFGTSAAIILEDFNDIIRGRNFTIGEYYLGASSNGRVNALAREYWLTVGQCVEDFGIDNCSQTIQDAYKNNRPDQWIAISMLIEANDDRIEGKKDFKNMPFRCAYWETNDSSDKFLKISGFEDFPVLAPRWDLTTTADVYGKGPGWDVIGDVKMLQKMQRDKLIALGKLVDPPVQGAPDAQINTLPGGVNRYSASTGDQGIKTIYQINPDLQAIEYSIQKTRDEIAKGFYSDLFLMVANMDKSGTTAREIVERHEEKLLMLGPVLERLESELLDPLIDRTFNIMLRAGLIPPAPEELQGQEIKVEYISMLAQAQKMVGTTAIEQFTAFAGNLAAVFPDVLDNIDSDEMIQSYGNMLGIPAKMTRSQEMVAALRKIKQKQAAALAQQQQLAATIAGAKVMSETNMEDNNALTALVGSAGGVR